ncbi:MAG: cytochrome B [Alphaproteobacteria bacterium]|uniref:Cytochrome B n=1 Tax=Candidatus Nitrobium versatile TaxID=2884831 RepID=A0A953JB45_9BACT|nr:cytochrome B [Candidatus Nitrobium versatile]
MKKPTVAFYDFACCEGCQLQVANLGEDLLDVLDVVEVVEFREVMSEKWNRSVDVAIVEGSITNAHAAERIGEIRKRAGTLIAYGSCATIGGVNGMKNLSDLDDIRKYVYGDSYKLFPSEKTRAVHQVVPVDYFVNGCPVYPPEFLQILRAVLQGTTYHVPDYAVCVECKLNENVCMYDRGITCLGPVTRAGCNSWCINNGNICYGCRGMVSNPNEKGTKAVLDKYGISAELIRNKMTMYNKCRELDRHE